MQGNRDCFPSISKVWSGCLKDSFSNSATTGRDFDRAPGGSITCLDILPKRGYNNIYLIDLGSFFVPLV